MTTQKVSWICCIIVTVFGLTMMASVMKTLTLLFINLFTQQLLVTFGSAVIGCLSESLALSYARE